MFLLCLCIYIINRYNAAWPVRLTGSLICILMALQWQQIKEMHGIVLYNGGKETISCVYYLIYYAVISVFSTTLLSKFPIWHGRLAPFHPEIVTPQRVFNPALVTLYPFSFDCGGTWFFAFVFKRFFVFVFYVNQISDSCYLQICSTFNWPRSRAMTWPFMLFPPFPRAATWELT